MKLKVLDGKAELQVSDAAFGCEFNGALVHQVVTAYQAAGRAGTKAQKTRAEVRGGETTRGGRADVAADAAEVADSGFPNSERISFSAGEAAALAAFVFTKRCSRGS